MTTEAIADETVHRSARRPRRRHPLRRKLPLQHHRPPCASS